jgi:hypothetical protein
MAVCPAFTVAEVEPPPAAPIVKSRGAFTVSVSAADVLAAKLVSPEYFAVIEWVPTAKEDVLSVACAFAPSTPVPMCVVPSRKATLPVGVALAALETVAVNATCCPTVTMAAEDATTVDVAACCMV